MKKIVILFLLIIAFFVLNNSLCFAASGSTNSVKLNNPIGIETVDGLVAKIIKIFLGLIGTISLIMFIYGGIMILTSAGTETKIKTGKETLVWASLGVLLVFASYAILRFVFNIIGL